MRVALLYRDPHAPPAGAHYVVAPATASDGLLDAAHAGWGGASRIAWGPAAYRTSFRAMWHAEGLAIRFDATDDRPWHTFTRRDDPIWREEAVEIFLDPAGTGLAYAEIEISPGNVVCDLRVHEPWPSLDSDAGWDWAGLVSRVVPGDAGPGCWTALGWLPWDGLRSLSPGAAARVPPRTGDAWRFNVCRIKRPGGSADPERDAVFAAWSVPEGPSFHVPSMFRGFVFG